MNTGRDFGKPDRLLSRGPAIALFAAGAMVGGIGTAALIGSGLWGSTRAAQAKQSPLPEARPSDPRALALWKRTREAPAKTPLREAWATVTRWTGETGRPATERTELRMVEGANGRYRLTYTAPPAKQGRVIVYDGRSLYHYEPTRRVVLVRPAATLSEESLLSGNEAPSAASSLFQYVLAPQAATVAGRSTQVLEVRSAADGSLRERRWVDSETGRSLRVEQYVSRGGDQLIQRVELQRVVFGAAPLTAFRDDFPRTARRIQTQAERTGPQGAIVEAARLGLPASAGAYRVRSAVLAPGVSPGSEPPSPHRHHVMYTDGVHAVSLFVTEPDAPVKQSAPQLSLTVGPGWSAVALPGGVAGFSREERHKGQSAVAWARKGRRYIAISRLPLNHLVAMARNLVAAN